MYDIDWHLYSRLKTLHLDYVLGKVRYEYAKAQARKIWNEFTESNFFYCYEAINEIRKVLLIYVELFEKDVFQLPGFMSTVALSQSEVD